MAWYHAQFSSRRFGAYTPNPVSLATIPAPADPSSTLPKGTPDSLFGPNIGPVQPGPAWTAQTQPKRLVDPDELTTDTVRAWIEKSKTPTTATTTLQALVNLRRPTLRLSPLAAEAEGVNPKDAPHLIEFQFDCAAPKCGVHVHVLLPPGHPDAPAHGGALRVFESVVDGGFARALGPTDAAVIELARFERPANPAASAGASASTPATTAATPAAAAAAPERKRFTPFHFRRRNASSNAPAAAAPIAGAALTVVDGDKKDEPMPTDGDDDKGVRVTIRLVALDAAGRELDSPNEHTVYLVVGRLGVAPSAATTATPAAAATSATGSDGDKEDKKDAETDDADPRPWLVRVVKREATIGPHTFQLHEIYGLSSAAAPVPAPAADVPTPVTYPPQPPVDDPPERECLLCLSAPREVVLLPCRHLVACRPCAINMVEFGAGGAIVAEATEAEEAAPPAVPAAPAATAADATTPAPTTTADGAEPAESPAVGAEAVPTPTPAVAPMPTIAATTVTTRRKRKAKGWFCPVCRQPYTSLLRITTAPPPTASSITSPASPTSPNANVNTSSGAQEEEGGTTGGGGILGGLSGLRPAFLRGLSMRGERVPRDVEAQA
ncbi:hypothetical protein C8R46DRAFT_382945 [Mycena filopes]|nr:hypothetical protein C8R46DRAFT_382945 [Mycena filopes]